MIEFGGVFYYIDIDALDKAVTINNDIVGEDIITVETTTSKDEKGKIIGVDQTISSMKRGKEIDGPKYEILRTMIQVIIDCEKETEESDTSLGADRALDKKPLTYKIAFNTLYNYGILKEKE